MPKKSASDVELHEYHRNIPLSTTRIRRHNNRVAPVVDVAPNPTRDGGLTRQVIHRHVEEALNLACVQVNCNDMLCSSGGDHVCNHLGGDGSAALILLVLARVWERRNDGSDAARGGRLACRQNDQKLHETVVRVHIGRVTRLDHEHVLVTHRGADADINRLVGELSADTLGDRDAKSLLGQSTYRFDTRYASSG